MLGYSKTDNVVFILQAKAGLTCEPEDPQDVAVAVEKFRAMSKEELAEMGENGKRFYQQELSLAIAVKRLEKIFQRVGK